MVVPNFDERLALGRRAEHGIADALRIRYGVIVTGDLPALAHHGPRLTGNGKQITLADLQFFGAVRKGWIEIKVKKDLWHVHNRNESPHHGIDKAKWEAYWNLQRDTGLTVYLMILECTSGVILMRDLHTLNAVGRMFPGKFPDGKPSLNFDRRAFEIVGRVNWDRQRYRLDFETLDTFVSQLPLVEC